MKHMTYRDAFYIYKVQKTHVSVFYHKPNSDMWESQRGFFLAPRAPHSRRHFTERASLEVRTSATRTDATVTDANDDAVFFISLNHAHTRVSVDDAFVRSSVRLFDQSIGGARTRFGFFLFPGRPTGVLSLFATRSRSTDANDGAKRNSLYLNPFVSSVRPFVDNRTAFAGIPIDRSVDRSIGTLDPDPRRRRGAKSDFILLGGHSNPWFDTRCNWDYIRISGFMDLECT